MLAEQPDAPDATLNLALALWRLGRDEEAHARLLTLLALHPQHVPALNRLAEMAWSACERGSATACDEVVKWCRRSLDCDPEQPAVQELLDSAAARTPRNPR